MKIKDKRLLIYVSVLVALTVAATVLRTVACFTELDIASSHFDGKGLIISARVIVTVAVLFAFSYIFFGRARESLIADFHTTGTFVVSGVLALAFAFLGIDTVTLLTYRSLPAERFLSVLIAILSVASAVYLLSARFFGKRYSEIRGYFGLAPILCLSLYAALLYFDPALPINAPSKIADQMAYACSAIFFAQDVRLTLGREKWKLYAPIGMVAFLATAYSAVPSLLMYFSSLINDGAMFSLSRSISESVLSLALSAFALIRVVGVAFLKEDRQGQVAMMISEREAVQIPEPAEEDEEEAEAYNDENQISIDDIIAEDENEVKESEDAE